MVLNPSDVEQKTFSTALRGYDLNEVDDFLDQIVVALRDRDEEVSRLKAGGASTSATSASPAAKPAEPPRPSTDAIDTSAIGRALVAAQETADKLIAEARTESERIVQAAQSEAAEYESEKEAVRSAARAEIDAISQKVSGVKASLADLSAAVGSQLDGAEAELSSVIEDLGEEPSIDEADEPDDVLEDDVLEDDVLEDDGPEIETAEQSLEDKIRQAVSEEDSEDADQGDDEYR